MKIISLRESLHKEKYYLDTIKSLLPDLFVYSYETGDYSGDGFAVWKVGRKWFYSELGHCSCNGPFDNISTSKEHPLKFSDIKKISTNYTFGDEVIKRINKNNKKK